MSSEFVVPEGQQWVIYRSGKFSRLVGPGPQKLRRDEFVQQRIDTRNALREFQMDRMYWRSFQFDCAVSFWYRIDLLEATGGDRQKIVTLTQFNDADRYAQATNTLRDILGLRLNRASYTAHGMRFPMLPGSQECQQTLAAVREGLAEPLLALGIIVDQQRPMVVEQLDMPTDLQDKISAVPDNEPSPIDLARSPAHDQSSQASLNSGSASGRTVPDYYLSADDLRVLKVVPHTANSSPVAQ